MAEKRPDFCTAEGAVGLCRAIEAFWQKRGRVVHCHPVPVKLSEKPVPAGGEKKSPLRCGASIRI
jgi:hypothetical protein